MKIIHVIFSLDYGGAETMLVDTMNGQVDFATVHLMVLNNVVNPHLRDTIDRRVRIHIMGRNEGSRSLFPIMRFIYELYMIGPDIIHCHNAQLTKLLIYPFAKKYFTMHSSTKIVSWPIGLLKKYDKLIAISDFVKKDLSDAGFDNVETIYNSIDVEAISSKENYQYDNKNQSFQIVQVARLEHEIKGQHLLLRALALLLKQGLNVEVSLIGVGNSKVYLEKLSNDLGISTHVHFLGLKDRAYIYSHLCDYHLMVHASLCEGFGLTVAEGMVAGLPVVVSKNDGPAEVISYGKYGYMCEKGNVDSLYNVIWRIVNNYEANKEFYLRAKTFAQNRYSLKQMMNNLFKVYND